jgi:hypothetical protein
MGFRFRRRVRVLPGLYLNVSKSGISTSIGRRGATLNLSKRGARTTIGIPGTGISWQSPTAHWQGPPTQLQANDAGNEGRGVLPGLVRAVLIAVAVLAVIFAL